MRDFEIVQDYNQVQVCDRQGYINYVTHKLTPVKGMECTVCGSFLEYFPGMKGYYVFGDRERLKIKIDCMTKSKIRDVENRIIKYLRCECCVTKKPRAKK